MGAIKITSKGFLGSIDFLEYLCEFEDVFKTALPPKRGPRLKCFFKTKGRKFPDPVPLTLKIEHHTRAQNLYVKNMLKINQNIFI
jgi:hypothetical protein